MSKSKKYKFSVLLPWSSLKLLVNEDGVINEPNCPLYWCKEQWGMPHKNYRYKFNSDDELEITFEFTEEKDASLFTLRWL